MSASAISGIVASIVPSQTPAPEATIIMSDTELGAALNLLDLDGSCVVDQQAKKNVLKTMKLDDPKAADALAQAILQKRAEYRNLGSAQKKAAAESLSQAIQNNNKGKLLVDLLSRRQRASHWLYCKTSGEDHWYNWAALITAGKVPTKTNLNTPKTAVEVAIKAGQNAPADGGAKNLVGIVISSFAPTKPIRQDKKIRPTFTGLSPQDPASLQCSIKIGDSNSAAQVKALPPLANPDSRTILFLGSDVLGVTKFVPTPIEIVGEEIDAPAPAKYSPVLTCTQNGQSWALTWGGSQIEITPVPSQRPASTQQTSVAPTSAPVQPSAPIAPTPAPTPAKKNPFAM